MTTSLDRARELLSRNPLIDGHNDLPWAMRLLASYDLDAVPLDQHSPRTHTDLPRLASGRVGAQFWSVFVPSDLEGDAAVIATLEQVDFVHRMVARYPSRLELAQDADDVRAAFKAGRVASLLGAEGGHSIAGSLGVLRSLYELGVRYLTLTHNTNVEWADSATDEPRLGGLSPFGREVIAEMNRIGMLVDLSHVSPGTMSDTLDATDRPLIFSHSSCRALVDHVRNVPDDILMRLAVNGGVCMVTFVPGFVSAACREWGLARAAHVATAGEDASERERRGAEFDARLPEPRATVADVADHVEHVRDVVGLAHVGIGGDYDGCGVQPVGLDDVSRYPVLFAELLDRGWSDTDCIALAGGNVLRVLADQRG